MSLDNNNKDKDDNKNNNNNYITLKRSTFIKLAVIGITALMVSSFLAGFTLQIGIKPTYITLPSSVAPTTLSSNPFSSPSTSIAGVNNFPTQQQTIIPSISLDDDPTEGNKEAPITLVEFSDYQCPFCKRTFDDIMPQLKEKYIDSGKIKHVFRDYPMPFHQNGIPAANAAECANEQGKFWKYHNILFSKQTEWESLSGNATNEKFKEYATNIANLEISKFNSCIDSQKYKGEVEKDIANGSSYGVSGTPTFYVGNEEKGYTQIIGAQPLASFESVIKQISSSSSNSTNV